MPHTMQTYIHECQLCLSRYDVNLEIDPGYLEMAINRARRDVQLATIEMFPERSGRIVTLTEAGVENASYTTTMTVRGTTIVNKLYEIALPDDFLQEELVLVKDTNNEWWPARRADKREVSLLMGHSWNRPTSQNPVFATEKDPGDSTYSILVSKGAQAVGAAQVKVYYLAALPNLENYNATGAPDAETRIGWDFEELVVLIAMQRALSKTQYAIAQEAIYSDIDTILTLMEDNYAAAIDRSKLLLPSRESIVAGEPILTNGGVQQ